MPFCLLLAASQCLSTACSEAAAHQTPVDNSRVEASIASAAALSSSSNSSQQQQQQQQEQLLTCHSQQHMQQLLLPLLCPYGWLQQLVHNSFNPHSLQHQPSNQHPPPLQLQQVSFYHRATHRARVLTVRLQRQQRWQDLQLLYDASGGGAKLNAIHLATVLQQLSRLAPMPDMAPSTERRQLKAFTAEVCCGWQSLDAHFLPWYGCFVS
jgi:hypothetical protein